jgi:IclR family transcriptional regulator, pca regulon regulatory protein
MPRSTQDIDYAGNEEEASPSEQEDAAVEHEDGDRDYVASLARGLEVICAFTRDKPTMTLSDVAKATGMSRATTRRLLLTLVREGYADKRDRIFSLRPKVLQLGYSALSSVGILDVVQPVMNALSQRTQESIYTAVLTGDDVTYLARSTPDRVISVSITIGNRLPAYAVSTGRVLLAGESDEALARYLDRVELEKHTSNTVRSKKQLRAIIEETRALGYSLVDEELEVGVRSLSVPIYDAGGHVVAALNACCPSMRFAVDEMREKLVPELRAAAASINERFQGK